VVDLENGEESVVWGMRVMRRALAPLAVVLLAVGAVADTFVVTTTQDSGPGSFRWAVEVVGPDTILFAIPTSDPGYAPALGVWTIKTDTLQSPTTYDIPGGTFVDGYSQTRFIGGDPNPCGPEIELEGPGDPPVSGCITTSGDDSEIRGLCINDFGTAITICGWPAGELAEGNVITGCYLNVDPTGSSREGDALQGIDFWDVAGIRIGGDAAEDRNVISGARNEEIFMGYSANVEVINNLIGTDRTGTVDLSQSGQNSIFITHNTGPTLVRDNVIVGDRTIIVYIDHAESDSAVVTFVGNRVGVGLDGSPMGASYANIEVDSSPGHLFKENVIAYGGMGIYLMWDITDHVTISRNSIYGNGGLGIQLMQWEGGEVPWTGVDSVDGTYGSGANEGIDPPLCESIATIPDGLGGTTTVSFRCMPDCVVEVFVGDTLGITAACSEPGYGRVRSGITYLGDAEEVVVGEPWSTYRFSISPALAPGTFVTATTTNGNGSTSEFGCACQVPEMGVSGSGCVPGQYRFSPPSPNPCTERTVLCYEIPEPSRVRFAAYGVGGKLVATILDEGRLAGTHAVEWTPVSADGTPLPGGLYLLRLETEDFVTSRRLVIAR
jgi:hypothetical protein